MKLNARQKHRELSKPESAVAVPLPTANETSYSHCIALQFNTLLYNTLQNMIDNAHTAGDFTYTSVADFIRAALNAYQEGMHLTEVDTEGNRRNISLRITKKQHDFYKSLPNRLRRKLLERAVRSFMKL